MGKVIKIKESSIQRIVKRVLTEQEDDNKNKVGEELIRSYLNSVKELICTPYSGYKSKLQTIGNIFSERAVMYDVLSPVLQTTTHPRPIEDMLIKWWMDFHDECDKFNYSISNVEIEEGDDENYIMKVSGDVKMEGIHRGNVRARERGEDRGEPLVVGEERLDFYLTNLNPLKIQTVIKG